MYSRHIALGGKAKPRLSRNVSVVQRYKLPQVLLTLTNKEVPRLPP
jgi:hypothetical protein